MNGSLKNNFSSKNLKKAALTAFFSVVLFGILFFVFRNTILNRTLSKTKQSVIDNYGLEINYYTAYFSGIATVVFDSVIITRNNETQIFLSNVEIKPNLWNSILGNISVRSFDADSVAIFRRKAEKPLDSVVDNSDEKHEELARKYFDFLNVTAARVFTYSKKMPNKIQINKLNAIFLDASDTLNLHISAVERSFEKFSFNFLDGRNNFRVETSLRSTSLKLSADGKVLSSNPIVFKRVSNWVTLVKPAFQISIERVDKTFRIAYSLKDSLMSAVHEKIAKDTILFPNIISNGKLLLSNGYANWYDAEIGFDSMTVKLFSEVSIADFFKATIKLSIPSLHAKTFFSSLPRGMFDKCRQIKAEGIIGFDGVISYNSQFPDSSVVDGGFTHKDLRLDMSSIAWITKVNGTFRHIAVGSRGVEKVVDIDSNASDYIRLSQLPAYLVNAVLINEDPAFFYHRGFITEALKQSLVENINHGTFKRGGSTLSMQLVKNLYLDRNKNVSRKLEEMLIVWLIENKRLISKNRMMELYFNIIEFGPGVYGISSASQFYFSKPATLLTKSECFFLANIIPRPKAFKWAFNADGTFREWMREKARMLNQLMVARNMVPASDSVNFNPDVVLRGSALSMVITNEPGFGIDSSEFDD